MNKDERIARALEGKSVDRIPISVWRHFSAEDQDPVSLAEVTADFAETYDFDFIKMMPFGSYGIQDLGAQIQIFAKRGEMPKVIRYGIQRIEDYYNLRVIPGIQGSYGKQVEFAARLARRVSPHTPFIQTIFSPLTILHELAGDRIYKDIEEAPNAVRRALSVIVEITADFVRYNIEAGVSGFFFATKEARKDILPLDTFRKFEEFYSLQVLETYVKKTWLNVIHIHGLDIYFDEVAKTYPGNVLNWHDRYTEPSLKGARQITSKTLLGGIALEKHEEQGKLVTQDILLRGTPDSIIQHIHKAIDEVDGRGLIIGPGCSVAQWVSDENLKAARKAVEY